MNDIFNKLLTITAESALEAALISAGYASHGGSYQPEEPEELCRYSEVNSEKNK